MDSWLPVTAPLLNSGKLWPTLRRGILPIYKTVTPKAASRGSQVGSGVRGSTHRRISCLVRNVKSWKANQKGGQPTVRRPRPLGRPPRDTASGRRPARELPENPRPAHLVLGQQLLGQATARTPHCRAARTAPPTLLGTPATFSLPPSGCVTDQSPRQPRQKPSTPAPPLRHAHASQSCSAR